MAPKEPRLLIPVTDPHPQNTRPRRVQMPTWRIQAGSQRTGVWDGRAEPQMGRRLSEKQQSRIHPTGRPGLCAQGGTGTHAQAGPGAEHRAGPRTLRAGCSVRTRAAAHNYSEFQDRDNKALDQVWDPLRVAHVQAGNMQTRGWGTGESRQRGNKEQTCCRESTRVHACPTQRSTPSRGSV